MSPQIPGVQLVFYGQAGRSKQIAVGRMANAWSREELDYFYISDKVYKVSQIRAKAVGLKTNLSLPEARDVEKKQVDSVDPGVKEFRAALLLLDQSTMSFVTNPLFQKTNVVEVGSTTRASHDLDVVIKLGGNLQKSAAALNKKIRNSR